MLTDSQYKVAVASAIAQERSHTPGPWVVTADRLLRVSTLRYDLTICTTGCDTSQRDSWEANARLIAAAPELLALCKRALTQSARVHPDFMTALENVIAKAEGK